MSRPFIRKCRIGIQRTARAAGLSETDTAVQAEHLRVIGPRIAVIGRGTGLSTLLRGLKAVSYTHLLSHETRHDLV